MLIYKFSDNLYKKNETLKLLGLIAMIIGHIGMVFFPEQHIYKIIGSIAFPIFSYSISNGYFKTSNLKKYMIRLWMFALISQIPYTLLFDTTKLNVMFTLGLSLFFISVISKKEYYWIPSLLIVSLMFPMEYGVYGFLTTSIFYLFKEEKGKIIASQLLLALIMNYLLHSNLYLYSMTGVIASLFIPINKLDIRLNRYVFYWLYPLHLLVIFIINII